MSAITGRRLARPVLRSKTVFTTSNCQSIRRQSTILNGLGSTVAFTAESLSHLHTAGLPWYIVLPLVATSLNFTIRLPAQWLARYYRLRKSEVRPLKSAWMIQATQKYRRSAPTSGLKDLPKAFSWMRESSRIYKDFGVSPWKTWSTFLVPMVPFVLVSEAVRRLAGSPMTWIGQKLGLDRFLDLLEPGTSRLVDGSLSEGGILWFTDLMAADPYGGLPLMCALSLGWSSWSRLSAERLKELLSVDDRNMNTLRRASNALGRVLLVIPLFPLLFWNLPSAVFLYWAPTFAFNGINDTLLKRWLPERPARYGDLPKGPFKPPTPYVSIEGYEVPGKQAGAAPKSTKAASR